MKLILKGHTLTFEGTLPAQYSANVPVEFVNDDQYKEYVPSVNLRFYCHGKQYDTSIVIKDNVFLLPQQFFYACGKAYVSILNKKDDVEVNSYPLALDVVHSVNAGAALPDEVTWHEFVKNYVDECVADIEVSSGTSNYEDLNNKPKINDVELVGNKTAKELGLVDEATYKALEEIVAKKLNDILVNGSTIVDENGVANIPIATTQDTIGLAQYNQYYGITITNRGYAQIKSCTTAHIDNRNSTIHPIVPNNLDYAVKQAMCDGKGAEWTSPEKASARSRLGCEWRYIGKLETTEDVQSMSISLDSEGKPFNLRKVRIVFKNMPNQIDSATQVKIFINNGAWQQDWFSRGVKLTENYRVADIELEKICDHLRVNTLYGTKNATSTSDTFTTLYDANAYWYSKSKFEDFINEIQLLGASVNIGANSIMEVWGVDA